VLFISNLTVLERTWRWSRQRQRRNNFKRKSQENWRFIPREVLSKEITWRSCTEVEIKFSQSI